MAADLIRFRLLLRNGDAADLGTSARQRFDELLSMYDGVRVLAAMRSAFPPRTSTSAADRCASAKPSSPAVPTARRRRWCRFRRERLTVERYSPISDGLRSVAGGRRDRRAPGGAERDRSGRSAPIAGGDGQRAMTAFERAQQLLPDAGSRAADGMTKSARADGACAGEPATVCARC